MVYGVLLFCCNAAQHRFQCIPAAAFARTWRKCCCGQWLLLFSRLPTLHGPPCRCMRPHCFPACCIQLLPVRHACTGGMQPALLQPVAFLKASLS
jgi:hypothetical protein